MSSGRQQEDSEEKARLNRQEKYKSVVTHDEKTFAGSLTQDEIKKSFKIDIPKNNNDPYKNPRYSSKKPIVFNIWPIFDEESRLS